MTEPVRPADCVAPQPTAEDWRIAVLHIRSYYPEDVFPAFSTSTDAKSGTFARHLCDLIQTTAYRLMMERHDDGSGGDDA